MATDQRGDLRALAEMLMADDVRLVGSGPEHIIRCFYPDHEDRNPSMSVNIADGIYHCHGCRASGNAYTYLIDIRGASPAEAHQHLVSEYGWPDNSGARPTQPTAPAPRRNRPKITNEEPAPPKWTREIWPIMRSQPLETVHRYDRADGSLAWVVARYGQPTDPEQTRKPIKTLPFTPAGSRGGGWWCLSPTSDRLPPEDRPFGEGDLIPIYGLQTLLSAPVDRQVWIVEGEKCADAVNRLPGAPPAVSIRHGFRKKDEASFFPSLDLEPLRHRDIIVFADPDKTGRQLAKASCQELAEKYDCTMRIVQPPIAAKEEEKIDIGDVALRGGLKEIGAWTAKIKVKSYSAPKPITPAPAKILPPLSESDHFRVLGLAIGSVIIQRRGTTTSEVMIARRAQLHQPGTLIQFAPLEFWEDLCGESRFGEAMRLAFADALIRAAEAKGFVDLNLLSAGRGAHAHQGEIRYNLGDRLLLQDADGLLTESATIDSTDFFYQPGPVISTTDDTTDAEVWARDLYNAVSRFRWVSEDAHRAAMGWIVTSLIGGALKFRPHLWIMAPSGTGKTFVIEDIFFRVLGSVAQFIDDVTEASLAISNGNDSLPTILDEFEASDDKDGRGKWDRIFSLLRSATSGVGGRYRASANSPTVSILRPRFSAVLSSIHRPDLSEADESRFVTVKLSTVPKSNWPEIRQGIHDATEPEKMLAVRTHIIQHTTAIRERALQIEEEISKSGSGVATRHAQVMAALTAGAGFLSGDYSVIERDMKVRDDQFAPLVAVLGRTLRGPTMQDVTISECIDEAYFKTLKFVDPDPNNIASIASSHDTSSTAYHQLCVRHGFRFVGESEMWVAPMLPAFTNLLRGGKYQNFDWTTYLVNLPDCWRPRDSAERIIRMRCGGVRQNVVAIGQTTLAAVGLIQRSRDDD